MKGPLSVTVTVTCLWVRGLISNSRVPKGYQGCATVMESLLKGSPFAILGPLSPPYQLETTCSTGRVLGLKSGSIRVPKFIFIHEPKSIPILSKEILSSKGINFRLRIGNVVVCNKIPHPYSFRF